MAEFLSKTFIIPYPQDHLNNPKILPILPNHSLFHLTLITTGPYSSACLYHLTPSPYHYRLWFQLLGWPEAHPTVLCVISVWRTDDVFGFLWQGNHGFRVKLLPCSWVTTPSRTWSINPALITGNMYWDSCKQCIVKLDLSLAACPEGRNRGTMGNCGSV